MVMGDMDMHCDLLVLGAGSAGCGAALRGAQLGMDVCLVDRRSGPGGRTVHGEAGWRQALLELSHPRQNLDTVLHAARERIAERGHRLQMELQQAGVLFISGTGRFSSAHRLRLEGSEYSSVSFQHCILCCGTEPERVWQVPELTPEEPIRLVGKNPANLEWARLLAGFGCKPVLDRPIADYLADPDLVAWISPQFATRNFSFSGVAEQPTRTLELPSPVPDIEELAPQRGGLAVEQGGYLPCDDRQRTNVPHILAAGSVTAPDHNPATSRRQGEVAAEVVAGLPAAFDAVSAPTTLRTSPPISHCGTTGDHAGIKTRSWVRFDGDRKFLKLFAEPESTRLLGAILAGPGAEEAISEFCLGVELGCLVEDLVLTIHPQGSFGALLDARTGEDLGHAP